MQLSEDLLGAVRITAPAGIRTAAEALRDAADRIAGLRVNVTDNIASSSPMREANGAILASEVFDTDHDQAHWWQFPQLALTSPLPMACRFESELFWCNAHGIYTRSSNLLLNGFDLSNFRERALTSAAIVVPIHLPFG